MMTGNQGITIERRFIQHVCNALHIYTLLLRLRVRKGLAMKFAMVWERVVHDLIY
jgi:hypothetical protein